MNNRTTTPLTRKPWRWLLLLAMFSTQVQAEEAEKQLLSGFQLIHKYSFKQAMQNIEVLAKENPKYQLAQLMKADFLAIKAGRAGWIKKYRQANPKKVNALLMEAKVRWRATAFSAHEQSALLGHYVLKSSIQPYLVIVNSEAHRLFLYQQEGGRYHEVANYYVSIGRKGAGKQYRGDLKTPVGVYQVVKKLPDERLPELYGVAALTLNYPNQWDRQLGRTGSGIWLHGTPRYTYSRPPLASRGCVVLNNPAMEDLINRYRLSPETPVIIASNVDPKEMTIDAEENKQQVLSKINQWLRSQQQYQVDWSQVGVFEYPGEKDLYYVSFPAKVGQQNQIVEQYWKKKSNDAGGGWQLVLEVEQATVAGQKHRYS